MRCLILALALIVGLLWLDSRIQEARRQSARMEFIRNACQPTQPRETAASHMREDGRIECAITYKGRLIERMEM